jgi:class 3 adenylate cyclase
MTGTAIRMGIHSGSVAMERLSGAQSITTTTLGETTHLAMWLQYLTEPGTLLTSEATV